MQYDGLKPNVSLTSPVFPLESSVARIPAALRLGGAATNAENVSLHGRTIISDKQAGKRKVSKPRFETLFKALVSKGLD